MSFIYHHNQLWFSHLHPPNGQVKEEWFYDHELPFTSLVEKEFPVIRKEIMQALQSSEAEYDALINNTLSSAPDRWMSFSFLFWDHVVSIKNCKLCPHTLAVLQNIKGLVSASVSILEPHTDIQPHRGDTNAIYRCHLPLQVPAGLPHTGIYVGYEERSWTEGKLLVFNDAAYHKAWNHTNEQRIVLIFDVIRPEFIQQRGEICRIITEKFDPGK